jgi:protein MBA1
MEQAAKLMRDYARRKSDAIYTWSLVAEKSPCKIVSLRAIEANLGTLRPGVSRYAVQALVKFDTTQRLEARERRGGRVVLDRTQDVTEYLVLERRLWQKGVPWVIREQLYEGIEAKITMPTAD